MLFLRRPCLSDRRTYLPASRRTLFSLLLFFSSAGPVLRLEEGLAFNSARLSFFLSFFFFFFLFFPFSFNFKAGREHKGNFPRSQVPPLFFFFVWSGKRRSPTPRCSCRSIAKQPSPVQMPRCKVLFFFLFPRPGKKIRFFPLFFFFFSPPCRYEAVGAFFPCLLVPLKRRSQGVSLDFSP